MSILHILAPAAVGGLESVVLALTSGMKSRGVRSAVIPVLDANEPDHPFLVRLAELGIETFPVVAPGRSYRYEAIEVGKIIEETEATVIHTHGFRSDVVHRFAHRGKQIRHVATAHGFVDNTLRERLYARIQTWALRGADAVIAVSDPIRERLEQGGVPSTSIVTLPNAVATPTLVAAGEAEERLGLRARTDVRLAWIGRISYEKGPDLMVEAMEKLAANGNTPEVQLVFIGDGPMRADLEARVVDSGLSSSVHFAGMMPEASTLLGCFDGVVLSSRTEGTPMVALEAMTCGLPVIAPQVGGIPVLLGGGAGITFPTGDVGALANELRTFTLDPQRRANVASAGKARVERDFSLGTWLDKHEAIYSG